MSTRLASPHRPTSTFSLPTVVAGAALTAMGAMLVSLDHYWDRQQPTYARFTATYGNCLSGTPWASQSASAEQPPGAPALLLVHGGGQPSRLLAFTARTAVGNDQLHPAETATAQILFQHQCPGELLVPAGEG